MKTEAQILNSMARYCSQAERCIADVRQKLAGTELDSDAQARIIKRLTDDKFIDETRFAHGFVSDKFKFNKWGRTKIVYELKKKGISSQIINEAMEQTNDEDYLSSLSAVLVKKKSSIKASSPQEMYQKLFRFALSRGFESAAIAKILKNILQDADDQEYI